MVNFFKSRSENDIALVKGYLTGHILVAAPFMSDARFFEAIVYICGHDDNGAMGFILNKPLPSVGFLDLLEQLNIPHKDTLETFPILYGGPVEVGRGFVLHSSDYQHASTVKVNDEFAITATLDILKEIAEQAGPKQSLLTLGYTGWSAGQLEQEIQENQWLILKGSKDFVYTTPTLQMWTDAYKSLGIDPHLMSMDSGHA